MSNDSLELVFGMVASDATHAAYAVPSGSEPPSEQELAVRAPSATSVPASLQELSDFLFEHAGVSLQSRGFHSYKELAQGVREGACDVAWLPPVAYAWLAEAVHAVGSLSRAGQTHYTCALVVRDDAAIDTLGELHGCRAGWIDPWSASGFVVPRIELARRGVHPRRTFATEAFYGSHVAALRALEQQEVDVVGTYANLEPSPRAPTVSGAWSALSRTNLRVLASFGTIPPDVLAVRRNLAPKPFERLSAGLRAVNVEPEGVACLRALFGADRLEAQVDPGHAALRDAYERALTDGVFD